MGAWPQQAQPGGSRVSSIKRLEMTPSWRPPPFLITRHHVNKKLGRGLERHRGDADPAITAVPVWRPVPPAGPGSADQAERRMGMRMGWWRGWGPAAGHWQEQAVPSETPRVPLRRGREGRDIWKNRSRRGGVCPGLRWGRGVEQRLCRTGWLL